MGYVTPIYLIFFGTVFFLGGGDWPSPPGTSTSSAGPTSLCSSWIPTCPMTSTDAPLQPRKMIETASTSWWFQLIGKIESKWIISLIFGVNIKNIWSHHLASNIKLKNKTTSGQWKETLGCNKPWHKDIVTKQPGFNGKYPRVFFVAHLSKLRAGS